MEDNLSGILITVTLASLFITSILGYIVLFPQEQGVSFSDLESNNTYLTISQVNVSTESYLSSIDTETTKGFDQWDITQGFMGSNAIKQGSLSSTKSYTTNLFSVVKLLATKLFQANSPIVYAIMIISSLAGGVLIYYTIRFVRQGS